MREICQILLEAPAKGPTIQYKPVNLAYNPLAVVNSAAAIAAAAAAQKKTLGSLGIGGGAAGGLQAQQLGLLGQNPLPASLQEVCPSSPRAVYRFHVYLLVHISHLKRHLNEATK
jgi:hypothetical protein